jgi:hypothetical protein
MASTNSFPGRSKTGTPEPLDALLFVKRRFVWR